MNVTLRAYMPRITVLVKGILWIQSAYRCVCQCLSSLSAVCTVCTLCTEYMHTYLATREIWKEGRKSRWGEGGDKGFSGDQVWCRSSHAVHTVPYSTAQYVHTPSHACFSTMCVLYCILRACLLAIARPQSILKEGRRMGVVCEGGDPDMPGYPPRRCVYVGMHSFPWSSWPSVSQHHGRRAWCVTLCPTDIDLSQCRDW